MNDDDEILRKVWELSGKTAERLNKLQKSGKTVTVKIKTFQYETLSKQTSLRDSVQSETDIYNIAYSLYNELKILMFDSSYRRNCRQFRTIELSKHDHI